MNSIFLQLAYQAHLFKDIPHPYEEVEKFGELIIRECFLSIKKDMTKSALDKSHIEFEVYAQERLAKILVEHFKLEDPIATSDENNTIKKWDGFSCGIMKM